MSVITSPLTTLTSMSTPSSYNSAADADTTGISSPIESASENYGPRYRVAIEPAFELKTHCQIQLEEELFLPAIQILDNLLTAGTTTHLSKYGTAPARLPPPAHLALLNTLTIHPRYTSRTPEGSRLANRNVATRAMTYLRGVAALTGPVNANLRAAFSFQPASSAALARRGRDRDSRYSSSRFSSPGDDAASDSSDLVNVQWANEQSLWRRASDFWVVLGWAFRCAAMHPERWRYWKVWLEFMVDVLERDWDERVQLDEEGRDGNMKTGSLLMGYLEDLKKERKNALKEVMKALMAFMDDDPSDRGAYKEVFEKELVVGVRKQKRKRADTAVDLDKGNFGDYWDADDSSESNDEEWAREGSPTPSKPSGKRGRRPKAETPEFRVTDGTTETVQFRHRLFRLLSAAADAFPNQFCNVRDLYERFADRVRRLPLPMFRLFIQSHSSQLPSFAQVELLRRLAENLLPNNSPNPADVDPETEKVGGISLPMLTKCFLPFAAGRVTAEDNARLSLVLETMLWYLSVNGGPVDGGDGLREAVQEGIMAREDKIKKRATSKEVGDKAAREVLARSARSLRVFVAVAGAQR